MTIPSKLNKLLHIHVLITGLTLLSIPTAAFVVYTYIIDGASSINHIDITPIIGIVAVHTTLCCRSTSDSILRWLSVFISGCYCLLLQYGLASMGLLTVLMCFAWGMLAHVKYTVTKNTAWIRTLTIAAQTLYQTSLQTDDNRPQWIGLKGTIAYKPILVYARVTDEGINYFTLNKNRNLSIVNPNHGLSDNELAIHMCTALIDDHSFFVRIKSGIVSIQSDPE